MTSSIGNKPLSAIDESLVDAGDFVKELKDDNSKLDCLHAFAESLKIVDWIRKETPQGNTYIFNQSHLQGTNVLINLFSGVNDLQKFVSVALHTAAGEGDIANDNLSRLKIIGSGYGPLIYDMGTEPSFDTFKSCCRKVWETLHQTPNLPKKLVSQVSD